MVGNEEPFFLIYSQNFCCGYLLELPWQGNFNKYPKQEFLGVLNIIFMNTSNYLAYLQLRVCSIQTVIVKCFVVILNVDTVKSLYTDIRYNDKIRYNDSLNGTIS